jgi:hypothetical protein
MKTMNTVKILREILICFILLVVAALFVSLVFKPAEVGQLFGSFWNGFVCALKIPLK